MILYNVNPADNYVLATMIGNFQDGSIPGKLQFGSGWWFLDQKEGMEWQLNALSNVGLLSRFVGMLTDSRSFHVLPAPRILPPHSLQFGGRGSGTRRDPERRRASWQPGSRHLLRKRQGVLRAGMRRGVIGSEQGSPACAWESLAGGDWRSRADAALLVASARELLPSLRVKWSETGIRRLPGGRCR